MPTQQKNTISPKQRKALAKQQKQQAKAKAEGREFKPKPWQAINLLSQASSSTSVETDPMAKTLKEHVQETIEKKHASNDLPHVVELLKLKELKKERKEKRKERERSELKEPPFSCRLDAGGGHPPSLFKRVMATIRIPVGQ